LLSDIITVTLHEDLCIFMIISRWIFLRKRNVSEEVVEKIKIRDVCSINFFPWKSYNLRGNAEKNDRTRQATDDYKMIEPDRPQMTIKCCTRFECWINNTTDKHSKYVILIVFPRQQWLSERVLIHYYVYTCIAFTVLISEVFS
jgi:hypothetical protein